MSVCNLYCILTNCTMLALAITALFTKRMRLDNIVLILASFILPTISWYLILKCFFSTPKIEKHISSTDISLLVSFPFIFNLLPIIEIDEQYRLYIITLYLLYLWIVPLILLIKYIFIQPNEQ